MRNSDWNNSVVYGLYYDRVVALGNIKKSQEQVKSLASFQDSVFLLQAFIKFPGKYFQFVLMSPWKKLLNVNIRNCEVAIVQSQLWRISRHRLDAM